MAPRRRPSRPPRSLPPRRGSSAYLHTTKPLPPENGYSIAILSPFNGATVETKRPIIKVNASSVLGDPVDIQVEWRTQAPYLVGGTPDPYNPTNWRPYPPTQASEHLGVPSGATTDIQPPNDLTTTSWYYRVRAGNKATNTWTTFTPAARFLNVIPVLGSVATYLEMNVGTIVTNINAAAYMDLNVGVAPVESMDGLGYLDLNVGVDPIWEAVANFLDMNVFQPITMADGARYLDMNVVTTRPVPFIWWIRPEQGREGYVFHIYGHGFGSFQNQYDGKVFLGSLICQVVRWVVVPRTPMVSTVHASGTRATTDPGTQNMPRTTFNAVDSITLQAGDTIEYDQKWDTTGVAQQVYPTMWYSNVTPASGAYSLMDVNGVAWAGVPAGATAGDWVHRKYVLSNVNWIGKVVGNFGIMWLGSGEGQQGVSVRSFVIRAANGDLKVWATDDDKHLGSLTPTAYTSVGGSGLISAEHVQDSDRIVHGQGLDPDEITVEHGWLTVVVPDGAVSAMVKVVLEGGTL